MLKFWDPETFGSKIKLLEIMKSTSFVQTLCESSSSSVVPRCANIQRKELHRFIVQLLSCNVSIFTPQYHFPGRRSSHHYSLAVWQSLENRFSDFWLGRGNFTPRRAGSPDLTPFVIYSSDMWKTGSTRHFSEFSFNWEEEKSSLLLEVYRLIFTKNTKLRPRRA